MNALNVLKVDDSWADPTTANPMPAWRIAMPETTVHNPILEDAAGYLLDVRVVEEA